jgi:hypothetical protein
MGTRSLLSVLFILLVGFTTTNAQCVPDTSITHNVNGIYPDSLTGLPHATVGVNYATVIQLKVLQDTTYFGLPATIDSMVVTGVSGLPSGFYYSCTPSGCSFPGGSDACILLEGPAPASSAVGAYPIVVDILAYGRVTGLGALSVPASITRYTIYIDNNTGINPVGSPARLTASEFTPNPARSFSRLTVGCPENGVAHIQLLDLLGNTVRDDYQQLDRGWNTVTVAADDLRPGIYLAKVYFGKEVVIRRMIVAAH